MNNEKIYHITNMTCVNCERTIENAVRDIKGVNSAKADYNNSMLKISCNGKCNLNEIENAVKKAGYDIKAKEQKGFSDIISILIIILGIYVIANCFGFTAIFQSFPQATKDMGYLMLFLIGMLTSVHCIAMCGGINLTQSINNSNKCPIIPSLMYNLGRITSYTAIGGILGGLGSVFAISLKSRAVIGIFAGVFMIIMGLNMIGSFTFLRKLTIRMPKGLTKSLYSGKSHSSFYIGLLNGLMPCGPLQSMQIFAVASGSLLSGALSMFFFSSGTVPLVLLFGIFGGLLKKKYKEKMMAVSAVLVIVLGFSMLQNNFALTGIYLPSISAQKSNTAVAKILGNVQKVTTTLNPGSYEPITVKAGIPVEWTIVANDNSLNGCNNEIVIPKFNKKVKLSSGNTVITFTPQQAGTYPYSCWMGMIKSRIVVD